MFQASCLINSQIFISYITDGWTELFLFSGTPEILKNLLALCYWWVGVYLVPVKCMALVF